MLRPKISYNFSWVMCTMPAYHPFIFAPLNISNARTDGKVRVPVFCVTFEFRSSRGPRNYIAILVDKGCASEEGRQIWAFREKMKMEIRLPSQILFKMLIPFSWIANSCKFFHWWLSTSTRISVIRRNASRRLATSLLDTSMTRSDMPWGSNL